MQNGTPPHAPVIAGTGARDAAPLGLALVRTALGVIAPPGRQSRLSILTYHRVLREADPLFPDIVHAASFARQLDWIRQLFNVLPLDDAVLRLRGGALPARSACITFDDGYADNAEVALPLLHQRGMPATFFISSGFVDGGRMWNDTIIESVRRAAGDELDLTTLGLSVHSLATVEARRATIEALIAAHKYLPLAQRAERVEAIRVCAGATLPDALMLRSAQIRELADAGMIIGAHTRSHPILARLDASSARKEIVEGREALQAITGAPVGLFAYPNGKPETDYTSEHVAMVESLGFAAAVSTAPGVATIDSDVYQLPRFTPWDRTPVRFGARMLRNVTVKARSK